MNEDRFLYYITICQEGNLSKAAEKLYISQPSLTKYINTLEKNLDVKLMDRTCQPIKLTEAGILYLSYAKDALKRYEKLKQGIELRKEKDSNNISLGMSTNLAAFYLPHILDLALTINPDFRFEIIEKTSSDMEKLLINNEVDIAFLNTKNISNKEIEYKIVQEDEIFLVCGKDNKELEEIATKSKNGYTVKKKYLEKLSFYLRDESFQLTKVVKECLAQEGIDIKEYTYVSDMNTILYLLLNSNKFTFVPRFLLESMDYKEKLEICNIEGISINWFMVLAYPKKAKLNKKAKKWISSVEQYYK